MAASLPGPEDAGERVNRRLRSILRVAEEKGVAIRTAELSQLLPVAGSAPGELAVAWLRAHPTAGVVAEGRVFGPSIVPDGGPWDERARTGERFLSAATELVAGPLSGLGGLAESILVTGSVAYGVPNSGDDCDLFVITKDGGVWTYLLLALLRTRGWRARPSAAPPFCFNYILDRSKAERLFETARGTHFAREALTAVPIRGQPYYRRLLRRARWMQEELPQLFNGDSEPETAGNKTTRYAPLCIRLASLALYPILSVYFQAVGLLRNRRLARSGRSEARFVVTTTPGEYALRSREYDRLGAIYAAEASGSVEDRATA